MSFFDPRASLGCGTPLLSVELATDPPVITDEATALQLFQTDQSHAFRLQLRDAIFGSLPQVEAVKADTCLEIHILVGVCQGVPCVAAIFRLPQQLPDIVNTGWKAHPGYLDRQRCDLQLRQSGAISSDGLQAPGPGDRKTNLRVSQVGVSSKHDVDVIGRLGHLLQQQLQLLHPHSRIGLAALQVGRHQTQLLTSEQHLKPERTCG